MKKRKVKAVKFLCVDSLGNVLSKVFLGVNVNSMYDVMHFLRTTEQKFIDKYHTCVVKWTYRILSNDELRALNIEVRGE